MTSRSMKASELQFLLGHMEIYMQHILEPFNINQSCYLTVNAMDTTE